MVRLRYFIIFRNLFSVGPGGRQCSRGMKWIMQVEATPGLGWGVGAHFA